MRTILNFAPVFSPSTKQIDFTGMPAGYSQAKVYKITNVTKKLIIYSSDSPQYTGSSIGNVLTLTYDTRDQDVADILQVIFEDTSIASGVAPATEVVVLGNPSVNVANTPNVAITNQPTVDLSAGSKTGLSTSITGTPNVAVTNQPTVDLSLASKSGLSTAITGTPNVAVTNQPTVDLSAASKTGLSVSVANTPAVTISGTPVVDLAPTASIAINNQPTVDLSLASKSGLSTAITGTPNVAVTNTPTVDLSAGSKTGLSVSVANTPAVTVSGTPNVAVTNQPTVDLSAGSKTGLSTAVTNFPATYPVTDNGGSLTVDGAVSVSNFPTVYPSQFANTPNIDASARLRVSQLTTLGDLKILNQDDPLLLENTGTGTGTFTQNTYTMAVTSGQFLIRRSRNYYPCFSGKSQIVECTFDNFASQTNVTKRVGYFSSNAVSPHDSNKDGFWLESGAGTMKLIVSKNGVENLNLDWTLWDNYSQISAYNWNNFTVVMFDYLWLGGAILRVSLKTATGFIVVHTYNYAGTAPGTFMLSPNQCVRYEIRSSTGTGSMTYICSQVASEGTISESGKLFSVTTGATAITVALIGTTYPIKGLRKNSTNRDRGVKVTGCQAFVSSANDILLLTIQKNPTLSAPLTYTSVTNTGIQEANGNGIITVTTPGTLLFAMYIAQNSVFNPGFFDMDFLSWLGVTITDVSDQFVVCANPVTATISLSASLNFKEF